MRNVAVSAILSLVCAWSARAIPYYQGSVTGECVEHDGITYNVVAKVTSPGWSLQGLEYVFSPIPGTLQSVDVNSRTRYFSIPPGVYGVNVGNPEPEQHQAMYNITAPNCGGPQPAAKGMTWSVLGSNAVTGTIRVGCKVGCDPRNGDTPCTTPLPLLCIRKSGAGFPLPVPASFNNSDRYNKWAGGVIGTTTAIVAPATLAAANAVCVTEFGQDWRVAEFHDGWGWAFTAYGGVGNPSGRFWAHINDQPNGTCWH